MVAQTPPTVSRFSLLSPAKEREGQLALVLSDGGDDKDGLNTFFPHILSSVAGMKSKMQAMVHASKSSFDALLAAKSDRDDLRYQLDVLKVCLAGALLSMTQFIDFTVFRRNS